MTDTAEPQPDPALGLIVLFGNWNARAANPFDGAEPAWFEVAAWMEGRSDTLSPEALNLARHTMRGLDGYKTRLETELRAAAADLQAMATPEVAQMDVPRDMAAAIAVQRNVARYEVAMYAAQRLLDAASAALAGA